MGRSGLMDKNKSLGSNHWIEKAKGFSLKLSKNIRCPAIALKINSSCSPNPETEPEKMFAPETVSSILIILPLVS